MLTTISLFATLVCGPATEPAAGAPAEPASAPTPTEGTPPPTAEPPAPAPADAPPAEGTPAPAAEPVAVTTTTVTTVPPPAPAEPPKRKKAIGGFGAFDVRMSEIDNAFGLTLGGVAGIILRNRLLIGGGFYGLVYHDRDYLTLVDEQKLHLNYAGGYIGTYALRSNRVDGGFAVFLAGGRACLESTIDNACADQADVFAAHVEGTLYIKLAKIARIGLMFGYDFFAGANDWLGPDDWDLAGFAGTVRLEFGQYDTDPGAGRKKRRGKRR
jgi:hypothetical protein